MNRLQTKKNCSQIKKKHLQRNRNT